MDPKLQQSVFYGLLALAVRGQRWCFRAQPLAPRWQSASSPCPTGQASSREK